HAGKTLEVTLFDPGEGMANLQIVAPDRTRPAFTWETIDQAEFGITANVNDRTGNSTSCWTTVTAGDPTTTTAGNYQCLVVDGDPSGPGRNPIFNNQTVRIRLTIPANSGCVSGDCWWRIRYQPKSGVAVTDRTVWSVRVLGDPVRLSE
ncbi:MAG: hypothetical protein R2710_28505, partial [Acidimicrobiales bacterium]